MRNGRLYKFFSHSHRLKMLCELLYGTDSLTIFHLCSNFSHCLLDSKCNCLALYLISQLHFDMLLYDCYIQFKKMFQSSLYMFPGAYYHQLLPLLGILLLTLGIFHLEEIVLLCGNCTFSLAGCCPSVCVAGLCCGHLLSASHSSCNYS